MEQLVVYFIVTGYEHIVNKPNVDGHFYLIRSGWLKRASARYGYIKFCFEG